MASSPVEFRHFFRKYTLDDCRSGLQPFKMQIEGKVELFAPAELQFRYREKVLVDDAPKLEWTDWATIPYVRDGDIE